jgi:hypothetical protein
LDQANTHIPGPTAQQSHSDGFVALSSANAKSNGLAQSASVLWSPFPYTVMIPFSSGPMDSDVFHQSSFIVLSGFSESVPFCVRSEKLVSGQFDRSALILQSSFSESPAIMPSEARMDSFGFDQSSGRLETHYSDSIPMIPSAEISTSVVFVSSISFSYTEPISIVETAIFVHSIDFHFSESLLPIEFSGSDAIILSMTNMKSNAFGQSAPVFQSHFSDSVIMMFPSECTVSHMFNPSLFPFHSDCPESITLLLSSQRIASVQFNSSSFRVRSGVFESVAQFASAGRVDSFTFNQSSPILQPLNSESISEREVAFAKSYLIDVQTNLPRESAFLFSNDVETNLPRDSAFFFLSNDQSQSNLVVQSIGFVWSDAYGQSHLIPEKSFTVDPITVSFEGTVTLANLSISKSDNSETDIVSIDRVKTQTVAVPSDQVSQLTNRTSGESDTIIKTVIVFSQAPATLSEGTIARMPNDSEISPSTEGVTLSIGKQGAPPTKNPTSGTTLLIGILVACLLLLLLLASALIAFLWWRRRSKISTDDFAGLEIDASDSDKLGTLFESTNAESSSNMNPDTEDASENEIFAFASDAGE